MSLPVIFSTRAVTQLNKLSDWAGHYSATSRTNLLAAVATKVQLIEQMPEMYPISVRYSPLRRYVVSPTVSLYYRTQPTAIEIVGVVDVRRDPDSLQLP